jgi:two-component system KDP operon response regulator KdpE
MKDKKKILLVDDERAILKVIGIKLRISGYEVVTASSGQEALDLAGTEFPDLMLLDVIMTGLNGFEVLEKLRKFSKMPVIVFSARTENAQKAFSAGADDFIAKPFNVDEMVNRIATVLNRNKWL